MADRATHYRWEDLPREELNPLIGRRTSGELLFLGTAVSAPVLAALLTPPRRR